MGITRKKRVPFPNNFTKRSTAQLRRSIPRCPCCSRKEAIAGSMIGGKVVHVPGILISTCIYNCMNNKELMQSEQWQDVRRFIHERDRGRCVLCSRPGRDCHHWSYRMGFFNTKMISLLCRDCHLAWRGRDPSHLPKENSFKPLLNRVAEIARSLGLSNN